MKKTPKEFRIVTIEEFYKREKDNTYWYWRFAGQKEWNKVLTPYHDVPYIKWNYLDEQQKDKENSE